MRNAYALLGLAFLILFTGAYLIIERAQAPTDIPVPANESTQSMSLTLTSSAFEQGSPIPSKYTCDAESINPELTISGVPDGAQSLVLLMDDPDIPENVKERIGQDSFDHWVLYNIAPDTTVLPEGQGDTKGTPGKSSSGKEGYVGPCPPDGEHRYIFRLYALDDSLTFTHAPTLAEVMAAMDGNIIEEAELIGTYIRTP